MAIERVLTRQKCAGKWCATFWDQRAPDLVALNSQIFSFHDFGSSCKLTSSPTTSKLVLGPPKGSQWGAPRVPSHGIPWAPKGSPPMGVRDPSHGIPWAPKGSLSHGSPPMGSLWAPKGPLPGGLTPPHSDSHPIGLFLKLIDYLYTESSVGLEVWGDNV